MDRPSFEKLVQNLLRRLRRGFKQKLKNISLEVEDRFSAELLRDMGIISDSLSGLYQGVPLTQLVGRVVHSVNYGKASGQIA